jgi:hypothetical protein
MPFENVGPPGPPSILRNMSRAASRNLEPSMVLRDALSAGSRNVFGPYIALGEMETYLDAARRQRSRIAIAQRRLARTDSAARGKPGRRPSRITSLFSEAHFYVICWARIAKLSKFIVNATCFPRTKSVRTRYELDLTEGIKARDHLDHFEDRIPGGNRQYELEKDPGDLKNMDGSYLTFGGRKFDLGAPGLVRLRDFVAEFRNAVLVDAFDSLEQLDPDRARTLVNEAESRVRHAKLTRRLEKLYGTESRGT